MLVPLAVAGSQNALDDAVGAFRAHDCISASRSARSAIELLPERAEPHELLGFCRMRSGARDRGVGEMRTAVALDPGNWRLRYALALALGASGADPAAELVTARRMNPLEPNLVLAAKRFARAGSARERSKLALRLRLVEP
jgi:Flp pilus assembly protein TadD